MNPDQTFKLDLPPGLEPYRERLEATVRPSVKITAHLTDEWTPWRSSFFGFPYFPKGAVFPTDAEGWQLYLLAQINFAEVPVLEGFPEKGILQFFIREDDMFGFGYDPPTHQNRFRVMFHPSPLMNIEEVETDFGRVPSIWERDRDRVPIFFRGDASPKRNDFLRLRFQPAASPVSLNDYRCEALIGKDAFSGLEAIEADVWNQFDATYVEGHRLGGYPMFTQNDPRGVFLHEAEPYELLLQIDSDRAEGPEDGVLQWGDMGVANFFIRPSALARRDFTDVLYNWDCC